MAAQEVTAQTGTMRVKKFLREVKAELKKVSWPSKQELVSNTGVVFVSVVLVAVVIWIVDTMLTEALRALIK